MPCRSSTTSHTEHKAFSTLAVLLPQPVKQGSCLCLLVAQEPSLPSSLKAFGSMPSVQAHTSCPNPAGKAACLRTDVAPTLLVHVTSRSCCPPKCPQSWGSKHVKVQRTAQEQRARANSSSIRNSPTRSPLSCDFSKGLYTN